MNNLHERLTANTSVSPSVSDKILAIRMKIEDSAYINNAVLLIASVLSKRLVEQPKVYS